MTVHADRQHEPAPLPRRGQATTSQIEMRHAHPAPPVAMGDLIVQAKLSVGPADDVYEREADAVADRVVRSLAANSSTPAGQEQLAADGPRVQRATTSSTPQHGMTAATTRIQRSGFTYAGNEEVRGSIETPLDLRRAILHPDGRGGVLDETFLGVRSLFLAGGVATSLSGWGELLYGMLLEDNDMGALDADSCTEVVENIKAEHRKEQFLQISEFYGYFENSYESPVWTLEDLKGELKKHNIVVDEDGKDDATLKALLAARGDREQLSEDPTHLFQFGEDSTDLDERGLKSTLDKKLGVTVNWGHEITDCMDDSGKRGEMYYGQVGQNLITVGTSAQSHASSQGGRTIIWERTGDTTKILAIGKHTTSADKRLSKGASYSIEAVFAPTYAGYKGKTIGFKAS